MKRTKTISIKDVAASANVSISTVSHVLNGTKHVSNELRERVFVSVKKLGYEVNPIASGLKSGKTNTIGVVVPSISNVFYSRLLHSIHAAALKKNYSVCIYETQQNLEYEMRYVEALRLKRVDGILLTSCVDTERPETKAYIKTLIGLNINNKHIPIACIDSDISPNLDAVTTDNVAGVYTATKHLISLGRQYIAYLAAPLYFQNSKERKKGYLMALNDSGIPVCEERIIEGDFSPDNGAVCMKKLLERGCQLDGVVVGNDQMAVGAVWAIKKHGLKIPDDIAVIGFDDNYPASLITPSLSSISVPKDRLGSTAVDLLIERIRNPEAPRRLVRLPGKLIVRQTTDANSEAVWDLSGW